MRGVYEIYIQLLTKTIGIDMSIFMDWNQYVQKCCWRMGHQKTVLQLKKNTLLETVYNIKTNVIYF